MYTRTESCPILSLIEAIKQVALQTHSAPQAGDSHDRLVGLIDQLKLAVETPTDTVLRLIYQVGGDAGAFAFLTERQPPQNAALRTVVDLNIFPLLMQHGESGLSAAQLAAHTGAQRELIGETGRHRQRRLGADRWSSPFDASHDGLGLVLARRMRGLPRQRKDRGAGPAHRP